MATSFNLQEYILFRTEIKRELTNAEVDTNFKMVANPWEDDRIYEIGNIVYHPVIVDDPTTTGMDQVLAWWRANVRTTQGVFDTSQWDMIGGIGSGNINIQGANGFGKINVNSTAATGALQSGNDALIQSTTPNDTFNFVAGQGMQLQYNLTSKTIKLINTLASNPGEVNVGENIGLGTGHQDIYAGKSGVNLQFYGLNATNTGAGAALSISTDATLKNIVYNFNEGLVDLAQLNSGQPKIGMLYDVSSNPPNAQDILQWNVGSQQWTPIALTSLGQVNVYTNDGSIGASTRVVSLNGTSGQLQFNRIADTLTGVHFDNTATTHQLQLRNSASNGTAAQTYALNSVIKATSGIYGIDGSFGINIGATGLAGLSVDGLSISTNNELYVPEIAGSSLQAAGVAYRIPLVSTGTTGRFESSVNYDVANFTDQAGLVDMIGVRHKGTYQLTGVSGQNVALAISSDIESLHDFASNASLANGYGLRMTYKTPTATEGVNISQWLAKGDTTYYGYHLQTNGGAATNATKYIGSNISLDNKTGVALNVGQIIGFTGGGTNPQRVGLYSNVVDTQANSSAGTILTNLTADSGTWAGYFVGCVNIDKGGLVLPSTTFANRPLCNDVSGGTISDRTLWINSANGHLYRGTVDIEAGGSGGSSTLSGLSDVTITSIQDDQLLVYNSSSGIWENATLAAYNLNAVALTSGGASIQLSDGAASSDVDLLPGTNITFSVNPVTDEITINSTGGGGGTGVQGPTGPQGNQGIQGPTGAQGNQGIQGPQGPDPIADALIVTVSGGKYFIDGVQQSTLQFYQGFTYTFDQTDSTNSTHPIALSTTADGTHGGGSQYTDGWSTNGGSAGSTLISTFKVPQNAPATLYYYCQVHPGMGGQINVGTISGAIGNQGIQGPTGAQGNQGIQGPTGPGNQGVQGPTGAQGNQGIQGPTGNHG